MHPLRQCGAWPHGTTEGGDLQSRPRFSDPAVHYMHTDFRLQERDAQLMSEVRSQKSDVVELVARACRILGKLELTHGALGHVSYRLDNSMLIKGKGPDEGGLRYTQAEEILGVDF